MSQANGKTASNGTAKNTTPVISLTAPTGEVKPELSNLQVVAPEPEKPNLSIDDIFFKMDKMYSLRDRREKLKDSLDKLMKFKLSSDSRTDNIILSDKNGSTFTTFNPEVITKTIDWLKEDLTKKIEEVENQIRTL